MTALDQVNDRFGKKTMVLASEGKQKDIDRLLPWNFKG
jgi:hypothetical protein